MTDLLSWGQALSQLRHSFGQLITGAVKLLLESKHLYQSTNLEYEDLLATFLQTITQELHTHSQSEFSALVQANWFPLDNADRNRSWSDQAAQPTIRFQTPDVRLFCQTCARTEALEFITIKPSVATA